MNFIVDKLYGVCLFIGDVLGYLLITVIDALDLMYRITIDRRWWSESYHYKAQVALLEKDVQESDDAVHEMLMLLTPAPAYDEIIQWPLSAIKPETPKRCYELNKPDQQQWQEISEIMDIPLQEIDMKTGDYMTTCFQLLEWDDSWRFYDVCWGYPLDWSCDINVVAGFAGHNNLVVWAERVAFLGGYDQWEKFKAAYPTVEERRLVFATIVKVVEAHHSS